MLRNIPNKVDQAMLKAIIDESSWGKYDFMYLRIDFANDCKRVDPTSGSLAAPADANKQCWICLHQLRGCKCPVILAKVPADEPHSRWTSLTLVYPLPW